MIRLIKVRENERGLLFRDHVFKGLLGVGRHVVFDPLFRVRVDKASVRDGWLEHRELDVIVKSGALGREARVLDLKDHERAIVSLDGRLDAVLGPGLYALWTVFREVKVEVLDARVVRFEHDKLPLILLARGAKERLEALVVEPGQVGVFQLEGQEAVVLAPGTHAYWKGMGRARLVAVDAREQVLDVAGQEIMTADKVTLRLNAVVNFKAHDPARAVSSVEDHRQALYREAQLALRAVVGARELDALLTAKDAVAAELLAILQARVLAFGLSVVSLGIRDVILPGEMKELLNKVTEAKKAAEANLITRREEVAAIRSQANTARLLGENPTLMRLRELEVLERVAAKGTLNILVGEKGLTDRVTKLI